VVITECPNRALACLEFTVVSHSSQSAGNERAAECAGEPFALSTGPPPVIPHARGSRTIGQCQLYPGHAQRAGLNVLVYETGPGASSGDTHQ
jgi:hypothetical protein